MVAVEVTHSLHAHVCTHTARRRCPKSRDMRAFDVCRSAVGRRDTKKRKGRPCPPLTVWWVGLRGLYPGCTRRRASVEAVQWVPTASGKGHPSWGFPAGLSLALDCSGAAIRTLWWREQSGDGWPESAPLGWDGLGVSAPGGEQTLPAVLLPQHLCYSSLVRGHWDCFRQDTVGPGNAPRTGCLHSGPVTVKTGGARTWL